MKDITAYTKSAAIFKKINVCKSTLRQTSKELLLIVNW